jgi:hypothetical protein
MQRESTTTRLKAYRWVNWRVAVHELCTSVMVRETLP